MGRTRMQAAIPITRRRPHRSWRAAARAAPRAAGGAMRRRLLVVQFGGAAGTLDKLGDKGRRRAQGAGRTARPWRRAAMAQPARPHRRVRQLAVAGDRQPRQVRPGRRADGAGRRRDRAHAAAAARRPCRTSRTRSPPRCWSRWRASTPTQLSGMHQALVHEQERSGAAWTLEWLILPQMLMAAGASTRVASALNDRIETVGR